MRLKRSKLKLNGKSSNIKVEISPKNVFGRFHEHLPHCQFKPEFPFYWNSQCPKLENLQTLVTINKTFKHPKGRCASSQTFQVTITKILSKGEKNIESLDSQGIIRTKYSLL